jgi:hypothetical protein
MFSATTARSTTSGRAAPPAPDDLEQLPPVRRAHQGASHSSRQSPTAVSSNARRSGRRRPTSPTPAAPPRPAFRVRKPPFHFYRRLPVAGSGPTSSTIVQVEPRFKKDPRAMEEMLRRGNLLR